MAAVFQRPMPVLDDAQNSQIRQQRRQRDSVEVINVDDFDDNVYQTHRATEPGPSRPAQRRRISSPSEIISLLDSDDEDLVISGSDIRPGESSFTHCRARNMVCLPLVSELFVVLSI